LKKGHGRPGCSVTGEENKAGAQGRSGENRSQKDRRGKRKTESFASLDASKGADQRSISVRGRKKREIGSLSESKGPGKGDVNRKQRDLHRGLKKRSGKRRSRGSLNRTFKGNG